MSRHARITFLLGLLTTFCLAACAGGARRGSMAVQPPTVSPASAIAPGNYVEELVSGGQTRHYRLHIPPSYQPDTALPLVIGLHGLNSNAAQQESVSGMSRKADASGFVALYPEGLGDPQTWHVGPEAAGASDLQFLRDLIQHIQQRLTIDRARIYAAGISNGAQMTNLLACEMSGVIAAVAPVSGGYFRA